LRQLLVLLDQLEAAVSKAVLKALRNGAKGSYTMTGRTA
jgi:hypothetical protein